MISVVLVDWLIPSVTECVCSVPTLRWGKRKIISLKRHRERERETPKNLFWNFASDACESQVFDLRVSHHIRIIHREKSGVWRRKQNTFRWKKIDINGNIQKLINGERDCFSNSDNVICFAQLGFLAQNSYVCAHVLYVKKTFRWIHQRPTTTTKTNNQFRSIGFDMNCATAVVAATKRH